MVHYASLYRDYIPFHADRPYKYDNRKFLKRWDEVNGMTWVQASNGRIPHNAVVAGYEDYVTLYVGRAEVNSSIAPGSINPQKKACFCPWGGKNHKREKYEVLCTPGEFVQIDEFNTLMRGTPGGISEQGEPLYIGRATLSGQLISGKIQRSYDTCYIPHKTKEVERLLFGSEIYIKSN
ncbi:uncharacterized protein LOC135705831 [Ochlerotatus camptorhynchus]|uniref:uncharacterized protein LOC135705831 n=1 Tax=Ochlerotatus camptorhynchus TaxID=644619 RepID=UPI0031D2C0BB